MPRAEVRGAMARGDRGEARIAKSGSFGAVPLGFDTDAPRGSAESFNYGLSKFHFIFFQELVNISLLSGGEMSDFWEGKDPCWVILDCSKYSYPKCPAFRSPAMPCWEVAYSQKEILLGIKRNCNSCKVYKLYKDLGSTAEFDSSISSTKNPR